MRRIIQLALGLVIVFATFTPLLELADQWDKGVVPATDTELCVTATFACAGLLLTVAMLARWTPQVAVSTRRSFAQPACPQTKRQLAAEPAVPTGSPPLLPLRI